MTRFNPTDDQLLSFLLGDLSLDEREKIETWLEQDEVHRKRLVFLKILRDEIKKTPLSAGTSRPLTKMALRLGAVLGAFIFGIWIQASLGLVSMERSEAGESLTISEPISWENFSNKEIL